MRPRDRRASARFFAAKTSHSGVAAALGLALSTAPTHVSAATIEVTGTTDSGRGSLRQAILYANQIAEPSTIVFAPGVGGTIAVGSQMVITTSVTIDGPGQAALTLDANATSRIFYVNNPNALLNVTISGLTLHRGHKVGNGGAIATAGANLTLDQMAVSACSATGNGGAVWLTGRGSADLQVSNSSFSDNTAGNNGGALYGGNLGNVQVDAVVAQSNSASRGSAAAFSQFETASVQDCVFSGNTAQHNFAGAGTLSLYNAPNNLLADIGGTTVSGNTATQGWGAGISLYSLATVTVHDTTLSGNSSDLGGAALNLYNVDQALLTNVTIANNTSSSVYGTNGAGLSVYVGTCELEFCTVAGNTSTHAGAGVYAGGNANVVVRDSIIAGNSAPQTPDLGVAPYSRIDVAYTLIQNANGLNLTSSTNLLGVDPNLGALGSNGGIVQTMLPSPTSPALAASNPSFSSLTPTTDARGVARVLPPPNDLGAVQLARCDSIAEGSTCPCTAACLVQCACDGNGECTGVTASDGVACAGGTCQDGTCEATPVGSTVTSGSTSSGTTGGTTSGTTGGTTSGTTGGTTSATTGGGATTGGTTSGSSKKTGCAQAPGGNLWSLLLASGWYRLLRLRRAGRHRTESGPSATPSLR